MHACFKSFFTSTPVVALSVLTGVYLLRGYVSAQYAYFVTCAVLLLAAFDFATVVFIEKYRSTLGALTLPAFLAALGTIFLFIVVESFNRLFEGFGYTLTMPFVAVAVLMIYAAIFMEKNMMLKICLGINSLALALLWALGATDMITLPF